MDNQTLQRIKKATREVEIALVNGDYKSVDSNARKSRLTSEEIKTAIGEYGGKLSLSPESIYNNIHPIEIKNSNPKAWATKHPPWRWISPYRVEMREAVYRSYWDYISLRLN